MNTGNRIGVKIRRLGSVIFATKLILTATFLFLDLHPKRARNCIRDRYRGR